ncbi:LysR family transcriptional regulator [Clostridium botulinum]|nr:LysR family transcriptional regulator [Clostridium botulinum]NFP00857.1 LysR family transcriptional regulator [Clostridium botulinum]NFT92776.1 LysR family transcriptional regulator [Clostridium botulinum]
MIIITIEQIQYFLAIKKYNGFSPAAHELCISQSSLSKQIKALENELDTILFDRASRVTSLTSAGEDFYIYAEKFLDDYNNIIQSMKKHSISKKSTLKIGTIAVITQYGLTSTIAAFKSKYPTIDINIFEDENDAILTMLIKSEIDFAIIRDFNLPRNSFDVIPLANDELVVVTSNNHPLAKKKYISFDDLKNEDFIICSKSGVYDICVKECTKLGFTPNVIHNINKIETILGLVSEGLGITLIVNNVLKPFGNSNISVHPLKKPINSNLALVTNIDAHKYKDFNLFKDFIIKNTLK